MLKDKSMLDYTDFFSPNDYEKNDKIIKTILFVNRFLESKAEKNLLYSV